MNYLRGDYLRNNFIIAIIAKTTSNKVLVISKNKSMVIYYLL